MQILIAYESQLLLSLPVHVVKNILFFTLLLELLLQYCCSTAVFMKEGYSRYLLHQTSSRRRTKISPERQPDRALLWLH